MKPYIFQQCTSYTYTYTRRIYSNESLIGSIHRISQWRLMRSPTLDVHLNLLTGEFQKKQRSTEQENQCMWEDSGNDECRNMLLNRLIHKIS